MTTVTNAVAVSQTLIPPSFSNVPSIATMSHGNAACCRTVVKSARDSRHQVSHDHYP